MFWIGLRALSDERVGRRGCKVGQPPRNRFWKSLHWFLRKTLADVTRAVYPPDRGGWDACPHLKTPQTCFPCPKEYHSMLTVEIFMKSLETAICLVFKSHYSLVCSCGITWFNKPHHTPPRAPHEFRYSTLCQCFSNCRLAIVYGGHNKRALFHLGKLFSGQNLTRLYTPKLWC